MENALPIMQRYTTLEMGQLQRLISEPGMIDRGKQHINKLLNQHVLCRHQNKVQIGRSYQDALYCGDHIIQSVWVMLDMTKGIGIGCEILHGLDVYPFDTHFIVGDAMEYRLKVITNTTPSLILRMTDRRADTGKVCYVLIAENPILLKNIEVPTDVPSVYAIYRRPNPWHAPTIDYFTDKECTKKWDLPNN